MSATEPDQPVRIDGCFRGDQQAGGLGSAGVVFEVHYGSVVIRHWVGGRAVRLLTKACFRETALSFNGPEVAQDPRPHARAFYREERASEEAPAMRAAGAR